MPKMIIAIGILTREEKQMVICEDVHGTVSAWKNLTEANRYWAVNPNNAFDLLSTVDFKVGLMAIPGENSGGLDFLIKLVGEHPTPLATRGGFIFSQKGLLIPKENHILLDDLLMIRE